MHTGAARSQHRSSAGADEHLARRALAAKNGQSIAEVAASKNVSLATVKGQITADAKAKLDAAVQNEKITQSREDAALQKLAARLDDILNKKKS